MGKFITKFATTAEYEEAESNLIKPNVSLTKDSVGLHYLPNSSHDYSQDYLTLKALTQGTITVNYAADGGSPTTISYSVDNGQTWTQITTTTEPQSFGTFNVGDKVLLKGNNSNYFLGVVIGGTATLEVCGNIMSMMYGDDFIGQTSLTEGSTFDSFFANNTNLISAENLILPATTLAEYCYYNMFYGCTSLTEAPQLLATTLADYCYQSMFANCTSLTVTPQLPATTLASGCYTYMFIGCTSLTVAPQLLATTLAEGCYSGMFAGCTSLTEAPQLLATTLTALCYDSMFANCTSLTVAPQLLATTLARGCYANMFYGCSNLSSITCLATDKSASNCTNAWVYNVAASGTFTKAASMSSWTTGANGIPANWTVQDAA